MDSYIKKNALYNKFLSDFQPDLRYIIKKYRRNFHALSEEELASEVNRRLLEYRPKYIKQDGDFLTKESFNKFIYACIKNTLRWTAKGITDRDRRNLRTVFHCSFLRQGLSENEHSSWERNIFNSARQESFLEEVDKPDNIYPILKWITDYSDFLTEKEMLVFSNYMKGKPQRETALEINETRQSVASILKTASEKINCYIKVNINQDNSLTRIKKGYESINHLFQ